MTRAVDMEVEPAFHHARVRIQTYVYAPAADSAAEMSEKVFFALDADCVRSHAHLSIGEARRLAVNLAAAADAADRHAAARQQLSQ